MMLHGLLSALFLVSLGCSVVIGLLLAVSPLLDRRYTAKWRYWVWLVLAARLLVPWNLTLPEAPVTLPARPASSPVSQPQTVPVRPGPPDAPFPAAHPQTAKNVQSPAPPVKGPSFDPTAAAALLWLGGAGLFLLWQFAGYAFFLSQARRWSRPAREPEIRAAYEALRDEMSIRRTIRLVVCKRVSGPMMTGFFRPLLLLPDIGYPPGDLRLILRHELIHYQRRDIWYKLLLVLARALHWFNPLVWLMVRAANRDLEISCDSEVVRGESIEFRRRYGEAILNTIHRNNARYTAFSTYFYGGKEAIKRRLCSILDMRGRKKGAAALVLIAVAAVTVSGCVAFRSPSGPEETPESVDSALNRPSGTESGQNASQAAAPEAESPPQNVLNDATRAAENYLTDWMPNSWFLSLMRRPEGSSFEYQTCFIFDSSVSANAAAANPSIVSMGQINFIPDGNFAEYSEKILPLTSGETEISSPLEGFRVTASYRGEGDAGNADGMRALIDGEAALDASLRLPSLLRSLVPDLQLFSGGGDTAPLSPAVTDPEVTRYAFEQLAAARPERVQPMDGAFEGGDEPPYRLLKLFIYDGNWNGFDLRFYTGRNELGILARDGSLSEVYTFAEGDGWPAALLTGLEGRIRALPDPPAYPAEQAQAALAQLLMSPDLGVYLSPSPGVPQAIGALRRKDEVEKARALLEDARLSERVFEEDYRFYQEEGELELYDGTRSIRLALLKKDDGSPLIRLFDTQAAGGFNLCYTPDGDAAPLRAALAFVREANLRFQEETETVSSNSEDPAEIGRLLFETYWNARMDPDSAGLARVESFRVRKTEHTAGDLSEFCVDVTFDMTVADPALHVSDTGTQTAPGIWSDCVVRLRGRREDGRFRLAAMGEGGTITSMGPIGGAEIDWGLATPEKAEAARAALKAAASGGFAQYAAGRDLSGYLDGSWVRPEGLERFIRGAASEGGNRTLVTASFVYELCAAGVYSSQQSCLIVYPADGAPVRYLLDAPLKEVSGEYLIGEGLDGPGVPLSLPK